jgi:trk system potassium uptake protein TrkA
MQVVIVGAGEVGETIAADLAGEHDVTVVERDAGRVEELTYGLDVLAVEGDGTSMETLEDAGVADADIVVASTDEDETNIVVCSTVAAISDAFTIARIRNVEYLRTWERSRSAFGIDLLVCTDLLTAQSIARLIGLPAAHDVDRFARGAVRMAEFDVGDDSPIAGLTVSEADRYGGLTFTAVVRDGDIEIPRGKTRIASGDRVLVIGEPDSVQAFAADVAPAEHVGTAEDVVIVGGGEIGYHVARLLGGQGFEPTLIEADPDRARELAEQLPGTVVLEHDGTDAEFLEREHVGDADVLVTALDSDERNLLVSLLGHRLGVERTIAVVESTAYVDLFETVGVDVGVSPREVVAEEITRFTRAGGAENVAFVESDAAEVVEVEVDGDSILAGRTIEDAAPDLPDGVVIGAITRDGAYVAPRGDTVVVVGDHVVVFAEAAVVDAVVETI